MIETEVKTTGQGPEQKQDADKRNSLAFLACRIGGLLLGVIIIPVIAYFVLQGLYLLDAELKYRNVLLLLLEISASLVTLVATIWAIQSYWRLLYIDRQTKEWQPPEIEDDWSVPYTFHALAESHKEWAQLWFSWCVAIFLGGVTYAIFAIGDACLYPIAEGCTKMEWPDAIYNIISKQAPNSFIYLLFGVVWYWASKHYRSHWHNFVINAYRHRALYRFEKLRKNIQTQINGDTSFPREKANETILELYRLSGVLLLIPGDSSYLEKVGSEEVSKAILQMEEITKAFTGPR